MIRSLFIVFILLGLASVASAAPCEVYGISDSPQKLDCTFDKISVGLRCQNGTYFLDSSKVKTAFHYEVEEGPTPLVFKASDVQLTVTMYSKKNIHAELDREGKNFIGKCRP